MYKKTKNGKILEKSYYTLYYNKSCLYNFIVRFLITIFF